MMNERIVTLVDMDCFYCQVEARLNPELKGKPMAVVQYNAWKGGGIIAVNYEARDKGVTRHMRGDEAKQHCPEIELVSVPSVRGKADLTKYRDAGREVVSVLCKFSDCVQRASVDEAYIDLTAAVSKRLNNNDKDIQASQLKNTFVVGYSSQDSNDEGDRATGVETWLDEVYNGDLTDPQLHKLATAAALVEEMRQAVYEATGFRCSAGVAHNKILAKLVCGLHKPNRQSVLPKSGVQELYQTLPVKKVRNLGGKLGDDVVDRLGITVMADLGRFTEKELQNRYDEKTGTWLYNIARGIDLEPVTPRLVSKSIGCCKKFPGRNALGTKKDVSHWLAELAAEVAERLEEDFSMNKRRAQLLTVSFQQDISGRAVAMSRSGPISSYEPDKIVAISLSLISKSNTAPSSSELWTPPLKYLGISAGKFSESGALFKAMPINNFFKPSVDSDSLPATNNNVTESVTTKSDLSLKSQSSNQSSSFFEKYLRNKSKRLPESEMIKRNCMYFEAEFDSVKLPVLPANVDDVRNKNDSNLIDQVLDDKNENISDVLGEKQNVIVSMAEANNKIESINSETEMWVSPSEIFPDMNNIDDNVLQLLPSPMQRKISAVKKKMESNENSSDSNDSSIHHCQDNRFSVMSSTSSDCTPTVVETVAYVHNNESQPSSHKSNSNNILINYLNRENKTANLNSCLESNCIDVLEDENVASESQKVTDECPHCKKQIALQDLPEHLDHHIAMDLHKQLNALQPQVQLTANQSNALSSKKKRGRQGKKEVPIPHKKTKTIASFFTRS